jgi:hypothetical protein
LRNLDGSENPAKNSMSPFNGNFVGGDGEIHNITELIYGGSGGSGGGSDFDPDSIIVQELGTNLNKVMSQDAVSKELAKKIEADDLPDTEGIVSDIEEIRTELDSKLDVADFPELPAAKVYSASISGSVVSVLSFAETPTVGRMYFVDLPNMYNSSDTSAITISFKGQSFTFEFGGYTMQRSAEIVRSLIGVYAILIKSSTVASIMSIPQRQTSGVTSGRAYVPVLYTADISNVAYTPTSSVVYAKAPKASPTFTGTININGNTTVGATYTINHARVPTTNNDLTNKLYVDTAINSAVSNVADQFGVVDKRLFNPYSWTPDEEIDFGDGLYGMRRTGSITAAVDTNTTLVLLADTAPLLISVVGGWWCKGGGNLQNYLILHTVPSDTLGAWDQSIFVSKPGEIVWVSRSRAARVSGNDDSKYDIAFTYIKTQ